MASWLGDYMQFRQMPEGKNVFLSIDSRLSRHNPLYTAWKTRSFTDGDITLHFLLFDILYSPEIALSLNEITDAIDGYLLLFHEPKLFEASTVRKKLNKYILEGIVIKEKRGKTIYYQRAEDAAFYNADILDFFSEIAPCGVVGSYLLDKQERHNEHFAFKHHYITGAMDSEILCSLFLAMNKKRNITLETINRQKDRITENHVIPLRIMMSVQSGRQYLLAYTPRFQRITSFRTDNIVSIRLDEIAERFDTLREKLDAMLPHMWGVSTQNTSKERMEHVEFVIQYADYETHIPKRLIREKRCGTVEKLDKNHSKFTADVFDANELIPWIRTFICRITEISFSNKQLEAQFEQDLQAMYALYGLESGDNT